MYIYNIYIYIYYVYIVRPAGRRSIPVEKDGGASAAAATGASGAQGRRQVP